MLPLYDHIAPFLMVLARVGGLFLFAPILSSSMIPAKARAMLAFIMAVAIYPTLSRSQQAPIPLDLFSLAAAMAADSVIGVAIGLLAAIPIYAVQLGGLVMGQQVGLGLGAVYNPALDTDGDLLGELLLTIALATFIAFGGLEQLFGALVQTFRQVPVATAAVVKPPLELLVGLVTSGFALSLRVAAPVLCIIMLETVATGLISKTIPQLNVLTVGFALKIALGLLALAAATAAINTAVGDEITEAGRRVFDWATCPLPA